jgi:primosomal protein N' (replication factor Y)
MKCPDCGITLTYHKGQRRAVCHYCGYTQEAQKLCPDCGSHYIRYFGTGTEKVEEAVAAVFPDAGITRLDLDSTRRKGSLDKLLTDFRKGKSDILIGTQLVAKGLDFRNVGFVGIVSADVTLNIPDFRSSERTFQLVTQAAGRAGRGESAGKVVIQSYAPDNYAIQYAAAQDYEGFYETEIDFRKYMNYPPYSDLVQIIFTSENQDEAEGGGDLWHAQLIKSLTDEQKRAVFQPQMAERNKIKALYRYSLLIKCPQGKRKDYTRILERIMEEEKNKKKDYIATVDINPYSFV